MKKLALALAVLVGVGALGLAQDGAKAPAISYAKAPAVTLHKKIEAARVALATAVSRYTVSVEIDYERADFTDSPIVRRMTGRDDPFQRYDLGPFSGLVVGPSEILISDRCLGEFSEEGPGKAVQAITVTLPNGERWPAHVKGRHQQIDLALLELDCVVTDSCPELAVFKLPSERVALERGETVVVVGRGQNPLGTLVNSGIVSALDRESGRAFQLDARIGNSTLGAPVVNLDGTLVGIVTLHNHQTFGQASGVSYAAYFDEVREAFLEMSQGKFVSRPPAPFMGVMATKKWPDKPGLEIGTVVDDSGAQKAGLQIGDVILKVNDKDMNDVEDLIVIISKQKVGDTLKLVILRGEEERNVNVTLGPRP